ncbi:MAG: type I-E CRISPR-associated protein Cas7/Cse4/CasC [Propionibacterium sp.]|nr:type I-E CRISPR-associated protein Cas7/Cse4/CasC [Propionibacterium sp.]
MLVQIHMIQNHAPSNLNRDDTGSPKEAVFGGTNRARISSQCLKRSIRQSEVFRESMGEGDYLGVRTRRMPLKLAAVLKDRGVPEDVAEAIMRKATIFGRGKDKDKDQESEGGMKRRSKEGEDGMTRQLIFLGKDELAGLADQLLELYESGPEEFAKMKQDELEKRVKSALPRSVDIALFGRMTTSATFEDVQASAQVAHAISTTRVEHQFDYFTAVDDLKTEADDDRGAGMISDVEFNSATYYKYFAVDFSALTENLGGDVETARRSVVAFLRAAALATPTGKQNTFAAHNPPDAILIEVSASHIPVNYANAFVDPVRAAAGVDVVKTSVQRLSEYSEEVNRAYGLVRERAALTTRGMAIEGAESIGTLEALTEWMSAKLAGASQA